MAKGWRETGDPKRTVACRFCGGEHRRRSKELRECRKRHRHGQGPVPPVAQPQAKSRRKPSVATGNPRVHLVVRKAKNNWPVRTIAKQMDMSVREVKQILEEAGIK